MSETFRYDGRCGSCVYFGNILCPKDQRGSGAPRPGERRCSDYIPTTAQMIRDVEKEATDE